MGVNYDILESEFDKKLSSAYQLSILIRMDSLVYFVSDANSGLALRLRTIPFISRPGQDFSLINELEAIFSREELFGYLFRRVRITLPSGPSVVVPTRLYNESEKETYLRELTSSTDSNGVVYDDELADSNVQLVYFLDAGLVKALKKQFPTARIFNPATPFMLGARRVIEDGSEHSFFVHISKQQLHLALFEKKNLLFYNSFPISSAGDVLYFTLLTLDQFTLDPVKIPVSLSGEISEDGEIFKMLSRYLGQLKFMSEPPFLKFGRRFKEVQPYFFFDLYSLTLCN